MEFSSNVNTFLSLIRAGLWENSSIHDSWLMVHDSEQVNWEEVYRLAEEQSVMGLVLAGIEHSNVKPPQELLLQWIGEVQILEQQNKAMNKFIAELIERLRNSDIYALLVKGQGIAQCYERPLWRASGDVDLLLSDTNYEMAKTYLIPLASNVESERLYAKHLGMTIDDWVVELHGRLTCGLSVGIDNQIDIVQDAVFYGREVRSWQNGDTQVFLPSVDNDIIFVFTHFLKHFYKDGLGLRQICDWCRLLWKYRSKIDLALLEKRIRKMGLISEWKAFGAFAVDYLGMPPETMPFYSDEKKWSCKARRIQEFVMRVGNMGHNRDNNYYGNYPFAIRKSISFGRRLSDIFNHVKIFPLDSICFFPTMFFNGLKLAVKGVG